MIQLVDLNICTQFKTMIGKKNKYIVIDRELEESFLVGDLKVVGAIIGVSHRKIIRYFTGTNFRDEERFIVVVEGTTWR